MDRLTAIVLGSAAGGVFPQWNCRCAVCRLAWDGDPRVTPRTQASLAVSADGEHWTLLNASPDLRTQLAATPALHPHALRGSPIEAVVLTGAEIDQTAEIGEHWTLLNASPDLRTQLAATPALHPHALRGSPIEAVVLTGAEIDQTAGLLNLREREPFTLMATEQTLSALASNPM